MNKKLLNIIKRDYDERTQKEIASMSNMTESDISLIWTGKRKLTIETFERLADGLGLPYWILWKEAEEAEDAEAEKEQG